MLLYTKHSDDLCPRVGAGTDQSIALAYAISKPRPDIYYMPNQYENDSNYLSHYQSTGPEIWEQTNGKITHFFTGVELEVQLLELENT